MSYTIEAEPRHVLDRPEAPLPGHYEAEFVTREGRRVLRYLTDKGRATILRRMGAGQREFTEGDIRELTLEPDLGVLVAQMEREAGEGA